MRVHQWTKNVLLFAPLLLSHKLNGGSINAVLIAFLCFSFMASASYLVNDMLDIESDRHHVSKRLRPFAAGDLAVTSGVLLAAALFVAAIALLPLLPTAFALWLGLYIVVALAYSFYLKRIAIVDVLLLSGLYTLRLLAGGAATGTEISQWLAGFSTFLFLSLAMVKRFSEIETLREKGATATNGRGYLVTDLERDSQLRHRERVRCRGGVHAVHWPAGCDPALSACDAVVAHRAAADLLAEPGMAAGVARRAGR